MEADVFESSPLFHPDPLISSPCTGASETVTPTTTGAPSLSPGGSSGSGAPNPQESAVPTVTSSSQAKEPQQVFSSETQGSYFFSLLVLSFLLYRPLFPLLDTFTPL